MCACGRSILERVRDDDRWSALVDAARDARDRDDTTARARLVAATHAILPDVRDYLAAWLRGVRRFVVRARLEPDDVTHHVCQKLMEQPPRNASGHHDAKAVVLAWVKVVARNYISKHVEPIAPEPPSSREPSDVVDASPTAAAAYERAEAARRVDAVAEELRKSKHLFEVYRALREDPDLPALELAVRVALIPRVPPADATEDERERARRAIQYAWQLRGRTLAKLRELLSQ